MAASALPETLKSITATKLEELTKQRDNFEATKAEIYTKVSSAKDPISAAQALLYGTKQLKNVHIVDEDNSDDDDQQYTSASAIARELHNKSQLLRQAAVDPSIPSSLVSDIHQSLKRDLDLESVRRQHAHFFSALVTEWLSSQDDDGKASETSDFEEVGRKEMHEQRATLESLIFGNSRVDIESVEKYLKDLFSTDKATSLAHEQIVKSTRNFSASLWDNKELFDATSLTITIKGLADSNLLSEEKNSILKTFLSNKEVLKEVADVLNMRYISLSSWNWTLSRGGIPVEIRRQLNGKYRFFMDEDVLDAILLYEIGLLWSIHLKSVLTAFFNSFAWKRSGQTIPQKDLKRREYFLSENTGTNSMQDIRRVTYASEYFLTQLPSRREVGKRNYDDDNSDEGNSSDSKGPLELKHGLLHMLVAESLMAKEINPSAKHTVLRSDFKWFGPGLPHESIFTVLKFFGINDAWLQFFKRFLGAPLLFVQDGPGASVRVRTRGIPISHSISDFLGEAVLFVMDFAVNQATSSYLYRLHDDFWIWGSEETCLKGWQAMTTFAAIFGIEFNREKTGTVRFGESLPSPASPESPESPASLDDGRPTDDDPAYLAGAISLPNGDVRWGFLQLDALSGRFIVDQSMVDTHIKELQTQLSYCKSVFSYIQAYNAYAGRFFTNNFGRPSYAFGRDHVDMMISTFRRIQQSLYPGGSVTDHLATLVSQRFNIKYLPQGVWYFPVAMGGLAIMNPLIPLLGMRGSLRTSPLRMLQKARDQEEEAYYRAEAHFKKHGGVGGLGKKHRKSTDKGKDFDEPFMPKEEYFRHREKTSGPLRLLYAQFIQVPATQQTEITPALASILSQGNPNLPERGGEILSNFTAMSPYWKWMVSLHGKDIVERYGSVRMVDAGQVPLGVVNLLRKERVRWRG